MGARSIARKRARPAIAACVLVAPAAELGNRTVLPRLYLWFHQTLAAVTLVAAIAAARLVWRRPRRWLTGVLALGALAAGFAAVAGLRSSQVLRYAASERTALASVALRVAPALVRATAPGSATPAEHAPVALPPLPEGPRRPEADVLLITVDALRADHVGATATRARRRPTSTRWRARAPASTRAYCQTPHTSYSVTSMMTGKYMRPLLRLAPGERHETWAGLLRSYG